MSLQVGSLCYATLADAGAAACSAWQPVTSINNAGDTLTTVTCSSADPSTGALNLSVTSTALAASGVSGQSTIQVSPSFPPCVQSDYVAAFETITGSLLAAVFAAWGLWKIKKLIDWARGDQT